MIKMKYEEHFDIIEVIGIEKLDKKFIIIIIF